MPYKPLKELRERESSEGLITATYKRVSPPDQIRFKPVGMIKHPETGELGYYYAADRPMSELVYERIPDEKEGEKDGSKKKDGKSANG